MIMYEAASAMFKLPTNVIDGLVMLGRLIRSAVLGVGVMMMIEYSIKGPHVVHVESVAAVNDRIVGEDERRVLLLLSILLRALRVRPAGSEHL
jgi:hypothetical protein